MNGPKIDAVSAASRDAVSAASRDAASAASRDAASAESASREARAHAAIASACTGALSDTALLADVPALLESAGVDGDDAAAILSNNPRFWLYREMVRNNVRGVTRSLMPRATALVDELAPGAIDAAVDAFLREAGSRSHYFRDVAFEVHAFSRARLLTDPRIPAYVVELADWELFWFRVRIAERAVRPDFLRDISPDRALVFESPALQQRFECRIHEYEDRGPPPPATPIYLLGYRDSAHEPQLMELGALAAAIVENLQAGLPLAVAIPAACVSLDVVITQAVLADAAKLLTDLAEHDIILGA